MPDVLDDLNTNDKNSDGVLGDEHEEEKEIEDIDPSELSTDEPEELVEDEVVVSPEEDPFGFGAFGELNEDGEFVAPATEDEDEAEDEISEDLF